MKTKLRKNEKVIYTSKKHWISFVHPIIGFLIIFMIGSFFGFLIFAFIFSVLWWIYKIKESISDILIVTNSRIIKEFGVFTVYTKETPLGKVNNVSCEQSLLGNIFGYGTTNIQSAAGFGSTTITFIRRPMLLKEIITESEEKYKGNQLKTIYNVEPDASEKINSPNSNLVDELKRLHKLKKKGVLTEEEFESAKNKLLK